MGISLIHDKLQSQTKQWSIATNHKVSNEKLSRIRSNATATAGALPIPAVQCIYVTPPFWFMALRNLLTTAGSCIRKSNASKSLLH
jgi:hypothetical protein